MGIADQLSEIAKSSPFCSPIRSAACATPCKIFLLVFATQISMIFYVELRGNVHFYVAKRIHLRYLCRAYIYAFF